MTTNPPAVSPVVQGMQGFAALLGRVFLPHLAAGLGVFVVMAWLLYPRLFFPSVLPEKIRQVFVLSFLALYGIGIFLYALSAACVYALRLASVSWENFIDDILDRVQEKMISQLDGMQDSLAKDQAKVLVRGSVREVFRAAGRGPMPFPKWVAAVGLGALMLVVRAVLTARVIKLAGTTVKVSKIFAGKATLAGAVFLNLRLFTTVLLGLIYAAGGLFLFVQVIWVISR